MDTVNAELDNVQAMYIVDLTTQWHADNNRLGEIQRQLGELEAREEALLLELAQVRSAMKPLNQDAQDCIDDMHASKAKRMRAMAALNKGPVYVADQVCAGAGDTTFALEDVRLSKR